MKHRQLRPFPADAPVPAKPESGACCEIGSDASWAGAVVHRDWIWLRRGLGWIPPRLDSDTFTRYPPQGPSSIRVDNAVPGALTFMAGLRSRTGSRESRSPPTARPTCCLRRRHSGVHSTGTMHREDFALRNRQARASPPRRWETAPSIGSGNRRVTARALSEAWEYAVGNHNDSLVVVAIDRLIGRKHGSTPSETTTGRREAPNLRRIR